MSTSTQLRYAFSKDPDVLIQWVNALPFKVELKSGPTMFRNRFYLFFVLQEKIEAESSSLIGGDLDE
jgi:hypothetical protein